jgi:hypothetical protein
MQLVSSGYIMKLNEVFDLIFTKYVFFVYVHTTLHQLLSLMSPYESHQGLRQAGVHKIGIVIV